MEITEEIPFPERVKQKPSSQPDPETKPPKVFDCRANAKFYTEYFRNQKQGGDSSPGTRDAIGNFQTPIPEIKDELSGMNDFFHAYYAKLNAPHVQQNEYILGVNGNLNINPDSLSSRFQMNLNRGIFCDDRIDSREDRIRRMYNPHMINRDYVNSGPRNTLKSEMQNLTRMLHDNLC